MAKLFVIITILSTLAFALADISIEGMTTKQLEDLEIKVMEECRIKENVDKSLIEEFERQDGIVPNTPGFKRVLTCLGETIGYRTPEKLKLAEEIFHHGNPEGLKRALEILEECKNMCEKLKIENCDVHEENYQKAKCHKEAYQKGLRC
ncbi:hypothetical protein O3M35_000838 [Rhynocoris fuscipes]|uniref:Uncharacterized protein n=1 Tax=Rhynocoris fuscipes TaxID=488301 RepID=A0AAW1DPU2_9HEMI